ncbi:hypothetical protein CO123_00715, partial [bacterium (Candidatus Howlettbacteria) CG_4_9_14_3_um_filter_37_10]
MYKTFNCGVGFIISAPKKDALKIINENKNADIIGEAKKGNNKICINSSFSNCGLMNIFGWLFHPKEQVEYQFDLS